ncbi:MAG TPA: GntR family transcriptional regulator [Firmicutes bacterium]|nr:GntR family transcriptional regulator [Bacillota bacterium]
MQHNTTTTETKLKADLVYDHLKEKIISRELKPGELIRIDAVAKELNVSKTPVREALKQLAAKGFVEMRPNSGARVARLDLDELEQIFLVRRELEALATRLAAEKIDSSTIARLRQLADEMEKACKTGDAKLYGRLNKEFHLTVYRSSKADVVIRLIEDLFDRSEYSRLVFSMLPDRFELSNKEHYELIECLERGDSDRACQIIDKQKSEGFFRLIRLLKEYEKLQSGTAAEKR